MEQKLLQEKEEKNSVGCSIMVQVQVQSKHGQYVCKLIPCVHDVIPFFSMHFKKIVKNLAARFQRILNLKLSKQSTNITCKHQY